MSIGKSLYTEQANNVFKTWLYMTVFVILFAILGLLVAYYYGNANIFYLIILLALALNFYSYFKSDKLVLGMAGARAIQSKTQYPEFWNVTENLAITAGLPMPKLYVIDDPIPNAFATGRNKHHSAIAATSGLLSMLNKNELEGVIAHEMSHIGNRDILISTVVVVMVSAVAFLSQMFFRISMFGGNSDDRKSGGLFMVISFVLAMVFAPIAATVIQLAISRKREFLADASGAILTRYPEGLASALEKISQFQQPLAHANNSTAHLYIVNPMGLQATSQHSPKKVSFLAKLFMTHPPTEERIKALLSRK